MLAERHFTHPPYPAWKKPQARHILVLFMCAGFLVSPARAQKTDRAKSLFLRGEYEAAIKELNNQRPSVESILLLSDCYRAQGEYDRAAKVILEISNWRLYPQLYNQLGEISYARGQYDLARKYFEDALARNANLLEARLNLGRMEALWGDWRSAQQRLEPFLEIYRQTPYADARISYLTSAACIVLGRFQDANDLLQEATKLSPDDWRLQVAWGRLFLEKYNFAEAQRTFEDALKMNPQAVEAQIGLAEANELLKPERSVEILAQLVEAHDQHLEVATYATHLNLLLGKQKEAAKYARICESQAPERLETLDLLGQLALLQKDDRQFDKLAAKVDRINAHYSGFYTAAGKFLTQRYLFAEAIQMFQKAIDRNDRDAAAYAGLGTAQSRLAELEPAKASLEQAFKLDPYNVWTGNLLSLFDSYTDYDTLHTAHFILRMHKNDAPVLGPYAASLAEKAYAAVVPKYKLALKGPVYIEVFPKHDDFAVRCFGLPGSQAFLGICFGPLVTMNSPRARPVGTFNWMETLWHEFSHVVHLTLTRNRIPRWLAEGISVYETTIANPAWSMNLQVALINALREDQLIPLDELDSGFTGDPRRVTFSYYQSAEMVAYLVDAFGFDALLRLLQAFRRDEETAEAIRDVLGLSTKDFDAGFKGAIARKFPEKGVVFEFDEEPYPLDNPSTGERLAALIAKEPLNYFATLRYGEFLLVHDSTGDAARILENARRLFPDYAGPGNPYELLARAYLAIGDTVRAVQNLQALLSRNGKNFPAALQLASLARSTGQKALERLAYEAAIQIYPYDAEIHRNLGNLYLEARDSEGAIREFGVELALNPTDMAGVHCRLAEALLQAERRSEAKRHALLALEIAPTYQRAQEILLQAAR